MGAKVPTAKQVYLNKQSHYSALIKTQAKELGFLGCGISKVRFLEEEVSNFEEWLKRGYHGEMQWLENNFDKRLDPAKLMPGAKSVVSVLLNYYPKEEQKDPLAPKIAKYAYGEDYHFVIKRKLKSLLDFIREEIGEVEGRAFTDSAPVMDRAWAKESGLGWIGKNTLLLSRGLGSFYLIGELILDLELEADQPTTSHCGNCTRCIDACPTEAILDAGLMDASKCISYLTIELKDEIPNDYKGKMENWAFGCDICQDVCPLNRFSKPHTTKEFEPHSDLLEMNEREWQEITDEVFKKVFKKSAVKRTKLSGLKRNITFLEGD